MKIGDMTEESRVSLSKVLLAHWEHEARDASAYDLLISRSILLANGVGAVFLLGVWRGLDIELELLLIPLLLFVVGLVFSFVGVFFVGLSSWQGLEIAKSDVLGFLSGLKDWEDFFQEEDEEVSWVEWIKFWSIVVSLVFWAFGAFFGLVVLFGSP